MNDMEIKEASLSEIYSTACLTYLKNLENYFIMNYGKRALKHLWNECVAEQKNSEDIGDEFYNAFTKRRYDKKEYRGRINE